MTMTAATGAASPQIGRGKGRGRGINRPGVFLRLSLNDLLVMAFFWVLLYVEPLAVGPLKISVIWKSGVILVLSFTMIRRHLPVWFLFAVLFAIKALFYTTMPYGMIENIAVLMEFFFLPVLIMYFLRKMSREETWANRMILISLKIALFFIFSTIPFVLGLESLYPAWDLSMWGSDSRAITSFFSSLAPASKIFYTSTLVLAAGHIWFPRTLSYQMLYWSGMLLGSYIVYASFTRTGWLIYAAGIVLIVLFQRGATRKSLALAMLGIAAVTLISYLAQNQAFLLRMAGGAAGYREDVEVGLDAILRSRMPFIFTAIDNLNAHGAPGWIFGHGVKEGRDLFYIHTGMAIKPHNGAFNTLAATGLIGLGVYLAFCFVLARALHRAYRWDPQGRIMYVITAYVWLSSFVISHGLPFYAQLVLIGPLVRALLVCRYRGPQS
ncbi:MAG: O-antigen ligase family protein [Rhodobacteraceae bacterium]|nr:O-antigen ligase family protein [Paracoccaceae bacterium]